MDRRFYTLGNAKTAVIGSNITSGGSAYAGCVTAPNGKIYFAPYNASKILELDPTTGVTTLVGSVLPGTGKYYGATLSTNGKIYYSPYMSTQVLEFDPSNYGVKTVGQNLIGANSYIGSSLSFDGSIYFTPAAATQVLELKLKKAPAVNLVDRIIPSLAALATSNYNKYFNKF